MQGGHVGSDEARLVGEVPEQVPLLEERRRVLILPSSRGAEALVGEHGRGGGRV